MKIIGLTGPSGAGKGLCRQHLEAKGIPCIDTDGVYHQLIEGPSPCVRALTDAFGKKILNHNGGIDRTILADIVFRDSTRVLLEKLNHIAHLHVRIETERLLNMFEKDGKTVVAVDAPLLFEAGFDSFCDFCIAVIAPYELRLKRIMNRDGLTQEKAEKRLQAQKNDEFYSQRAKYTVVNDLNRENTVRQIETILMQEGL